MQKASLRGPFQLESIVNDDKYLDEYGEARLLKLATKDQTPYEAGEVMELYSYGCGHQQSLYIQARNDFLMNKLVDCPSAQPCPTTSSECKKDVNPMYAKINEAVAIAQVKAPESDLYKARKHLEGRLDEVYSEKRTALRAQYHMDPVYPKTRGEFVEWLKAGKFQLADGKADRPFSSYDALRSITLGDAVKDEAGYKTAKETLVKFREDTRDIIKALDEKAGFEALKAFQA